VVHTAAWTSSIKRLELSRSCLSWVVREISDALSRRFSVHSIDTCAFSSSIRTLSVELSLKIKSASCGFLRLSINLT